MAFDTKGGLGGAASGAAAGSLVMPGWGTAIGAGLGGLLGLFGGGKKEKQQQLPRLSPEQQKVLSQLTSAAQNRGAGGSFGQAADYYRDLLGDNPEDFQRFAAPEMRRFNEQIVPGLSEQFAGMGSGGLTSSGFRNATINAGTDLSERLAALRAQLRSQGAAGLTGIGQQALGGYTENLMRPGTPGAANEVFTGIAGGLGQSLPGLIADRLKNTGPLSGYNTQTQVGQNIYGQSQPALRR